MDGLPVNLYGTHLPILMSPNHLNINKIQIPDTITMNNTHPIYKDWALDGGGATFREEAVLQSACCGFVFLSLKSKPSSSPFTSAKTFFEINKFEVFHF